MSNRRLHPFRPTLAIASLTLAMLPLMNVCHADVALHPLFTDHGVLQQDMPVPVWGTADADAEIIVRWGEQIKETTADSDGNWMTILDPTPASTEGQTLTVDSGDQTAAARHLLVGEVWVCSGQSNMAMSTSRTDDFETITTELKNTSNLSNIRLFRVPVAGADDRQETVDAKWTTVDEHSAGSFSAVGLYFGRALSRDRNVPVGLIQAANGGTNAYSWINNDTYLNDPVAQVTRDHWASLMTNASTQLEKYKENKAKWLEKAKQAREEGTPFTQRSPREPMHATHVKRPTGHYNAMVAPLQPYAIRGAIWYQGEANSRPPFCFQYKDLMLSLVDDWRTDWAAATEDTRRDFPFYLVQLPNYGNGPSWPVIREQMLQFWQQGDHTGMVVAIDVGDPDDIHPRNKLPIGERLSLFARANTYGEQIVYSGPIYSDHKVKGSEVAIEFKHVGDGLKSSDGEDLRNFQIAGDDGKFVDATARIESNQVVVSSPDVPKPAAVRYAWSPNPNRINFVNEQGLPASPFRTDDAPLQ
ncbi:MAG: hypothetical protein HKN47_22640 [Pirellulaceae bacterium]|nr:hypothetical protein [Pirellulaceae bacterium]